jgi:hypothetical protein
MPRGVFKTLFGAIVGLVCAATASAQLIPIPLVTWKYQQPWTAPWHSHDSVVRDCQGGSVSFANIALDDWICTATGPIVRVRWWGTSPQPAQTPNRPFLIRIFSTGAAACQPAQLLYSVCVLASNQYVGFDCRDRKVYRFQANLTPAFTQVAGQHYWIQISEVDFMPGTNFVSPTIGAIDFEWSAHRNIKNCPAGQRTPAGVWTAPLFDDCDQLEEDLAFVLYRSAIIIHTPPNNPTGLATLPRPVYIAEFRKQGDPDTLAYVECFTADDDGTASLHPELPPGNYVMSVRGMSFRPAFFDIFVDVDWNYVTDVGMICCPGDVDGDGFVRFSDVTGVLANWAP